MNQTDVGKFIASCRKEKNLTQAKLAEKLNITDRAVSKWETGKSMPDSSIMLELCDILGVTVNELLSGEKISMQEYGKKAEENLIGLKKKEENNLSKNIIISIIFTSILLIGIAVCMICDIAISGKLTWALIPIASIVFGWVVLFPIIISGKKGLRTSLLALSIFIIPFLYILSIIIKENAILSIGIVTSIISIVFLWTIYKICYKFKDRKYIATGITLLLLMLANIIINAAISKILNDVTTNLPNIIISFVLLIFAFMSFAFGYAKNRGLIK